MLVRGMVMKDKMITKDSSKMNERIAVLERKIRELEQTISDQQRSMEALQETEELFEQFMENSPIHVFFKDNHIRSIRLSRNYEKMLGRPLEEILGKTMDDLFPSDLAKSMIADDLRILNSGKQITVEEELNGRFFTTSKFPISFQGKPRYLAGYTMDITERKLAELSLAHSEEKFRKVFYISPDPTCITSLEDGRLLMVNRAFTKVTGYTEEEVLGKSVLDMQLYKNADDRKRLLAALKKDGEVVNFEIAFRAKSGQTLSGLTSADVIAIDGVPCCMSITRDITQRIQMYEKLQGSMTLLRRALETTIQVLVLAVEGRDPYTAGHQRRTTDLARAIASEMGLSTENIEGIRLAGVIHDLGKITIPSEILSKPSKLSKIEYSFVKEHARQGYEILKDVESPYPLAQIVYQHHERMDGTGYPRKLKGDKILIEARILAVADVVEAMASHRPYRPARGIDSALEEIEMHRGTLYDADAVNACLSVFREKGFQFHAA